MDAPVLGLATAGLALTTAGLITGTADVARRVHDYRTSAATAPNVSIDDPRLRALSGQTPGMVSNQQQAETRARELAEQRLAAAAGATANPRRLWISATVAFTGVLLSGAADIVAAIHTTH